MQVFSHCVIIFHLVQGQLCRRTMTSAVRLTERPGISPDSRAPLPRRPVLQESDGPKLYANTSSVAARQCLKEVREKLAEQDAKISAQDEKIAAQNIKIEEQSKEIQNLKTLSQQHATAISNRDTEVEKLRKGLATNECDLDERSIEYTQGIDKLRQEFHTKSTGWIEDITLLGRQYNTLDKDVTTLFLSKGMSRKTDQLKANTPSIDLTKPAPSKKYKKRDRSESSEEPRRRRGKR